MLDYKLIEALALVIDEGGFERASASLCITQSAVSQRIRLLEEVCGQILLIRSSPPEPTPVGRNLLKHYRQVKLLEENLLVDLSINEDGPSPTLTIAVNAADLVSELSF